MPVPRRGDCLHGRRSTAVDARLQEIDFGEWEGKAWEAIDRAAIDLWAASPLTFAPPGGESGAALIERVSEFHDQLRRERQDCVVVSHGGPLKMLDALLRGIPVDLLAAAPSLGSVTLMTCAPAYQVMSAGDPKPNGGIRATTPLRNDNGRCRHGMMPVSVAA